MKWSVGKIISKRAVLTPDRTAVIYEDTPITYGALNDEVNRVCNFFQEKGLRKGDRIAVDMLNCPQLLVCYFAAAKLGLIFVPLIYRLMPRELEYQINRCGARLLIFHDDVLKNIEKIRSSVCVEEDKFIFFKSNSVGSPDCPGWAIDYYQSISGRLSSEPVIEEQIDLEDPLAILYTSGVTGDPKGAVISHGQNYFKSFHIIDYTDMRKDDVILCHIPLCHSGGLCVAATPCLCRGATLVLRTKFDPVLFALDIEKYKATIVVAFVTMLRFVLQAGILDKVDVSSVRVLFGGAEVTTKGFLNELAGKGLHLLTGYGQTENSSMVLMPKDALRRKQDSCGLPNFFSEVWIQNEKGEKLAPFEVGEIVATGPNVMSCYWDAPEETKNTIVDGVLHTGDQGYTDEEGFLYMVDRIKNMYRSGGENVYPAEVERILLGHPKIENVAIIGVPDETWGETGKAYIVCREGETPTKEDIINFLNEKVAKYKVPKHIEFIDSLPLTASGKLRKSILEEMHFNPKTTEKGDN
ncbi:class I adenylate-forming enzyme family protein [Desulfosarcina ovata]|uniref:Long-chain fatty acid--CoA ligase n=1 Tax=Desulfosarcina ovata subsp. ovata TaxID=2752305 RepID=A0A5K8A635_9BACT|nr:AMP-binding protein [Desulfosarcina ovata]BBO88083.1 long-chain fatty acid--CoA ligase [Desulfosarcina ovata subsp. ovata]